MAFYILLLMSCALVDVLSAQSVISTQHCEVDDDVCVTDAVKAAFPLILQPNDNIGAEEMDPMFLEEVDGDLPLLKFKLENTTVKGLKSCEVQSARYLDKTREMLHLDIICPKLIMEGLYSGKGQLFTFYVEGDGDFTVETNKYSFIFEWEVKTVTKNGKSYRTVKSFKLMSEPLEKVIFDPRNLFNGRKDLAEPVINFANAHWKEVMTLVQGPLFTPIAKKMVKNANKYLKTAAVDGN